MNEKILEILIVEDEPGLGDLIARFIKLKGVRANTTVCTKASDAHAELRNKRFDLVITDFNVPTGSEGAEITQAAKALYNIPVIVMSARMEASQQQIHELCNADGYLAKPIMDWSGPIAMIKRLLHLSDQTAP
jgi:CheY-like chemotaxis protein